MDGNGRWAELRGHSRVFGHVRGAKVAKSIIEESVRMGIKSLTLFTFSTENWQRPEFEISFLMRLLKKYLVREQKVLMQQNIRFRCIGDVSRLPTAALQEVQNTIQLTKNNSGMDLVFALSYGGRQEIVAACKQLSQKCIEGKITPEQIDENVFSSELESSFLHDPDLIIRTSGESRISNFFLWQSAYSEICFLNTLWPDFTAEDFNRSLKYYSSRERRFGKTSLQISEAEIS